MGQEDMRWAIDTGFVFNGVHFGPGEKVPENMPEATKEEFFRQRKLAKVVNGKVIRFQREIELNDVQIDLLLTNSLPTIEATLESGSFSKETIGRISIKAIQRNLPQVVKFLQGKIKVEKAVAVINLVDEKEKTVNTTKTEEKVEKVEKEQEKSSEEVKQENKNEEIRGNVEKMTVHCLKCKEEKECVGKIVVVDTKKRKGVRIFKGVCPTCGMKVNKFLPKTD